MPPGWRPGYDDRLRRLVWIREVSPGTPSLDSRRMGMIRPTRLRWLAGRREPAEAWDVFEAIPGLPLDEACARPRGWADVRWWLLDLARECDAQSSEDRPLLRADRVWVLDTGGAKLVDDPSVDRLAAPSGGGQGACASLLLDVVRVVRDSSIEHWPLSAHRFFDWLPADPPHSASEIVGELEPLTRQRAVVTRGWRALHLLGVAALPLLVSGLGIVARADHVANPPNPPKPGEVLRAGSLLSDLRLADLQGYPYRSPQDLEAIEVALASRYRHVLTDPRVSTKEFGFMGVYARAQIERVLRRQPTESEIRRANERPYLRTRVSAFDVQPGMLGALLFAAISLIINLNAALVIVAICALVAAIAFRGGFMRLLGLEIVTADGSPASRLRVLARYSRRLDTDHRAGDSAESTAQFPRFEPWELW